jgi:hypothetical protein
MKILAKLKLTKRQASQLLKNHVVLSNQLCGKQLASQRHKSNPAWDSKRREGKSLPANRINLAQVEASVTRKVLAQEIDKEAAHKLVEDCQICAKLTMI